MRNVRKEASKSAVKPVSAPPEAAMIAELPYCEVNCASNSPVVSQLAPIQTRNVKPIGPTNTSISINAKLKRSLKWRRARPRQVKKPTVHIAVNAMIRASYRAKNASASPNPVTTKSCIPSVDVQRINLRTDHKVAKINGASLIPVAPYAMIMGLSANKSTPTTATQCRTFLSLAISHNSRTAPAIKATETNAPASPYRVSSGIHGDRATSGICNTVVKGVNTNPITPSPGYRAYTADSAACVRDKASPQIYCTSKASHNAAAP